MIVLALDTATPDTVVGLAGAGEEIALRHTPAPGARPAHATALLALAERALARAGLDWPDLDRIGVGVGPGSFTGLRIGVATARALSQSSGAALAAVSTLQALATGADAAGPVLACLDARRGEAFTAGWQAGSPVHAAAATRPDDLAALVAAGWLAVGGGAVRFRGELEAAGATVAPDDDPRHHVSGAVLCALAAVAEPVDRDVLVPDYVRDPDAKERAR